MENKTPLYIDPRVLNIDFNITMDPRSRKEILSEQTYLILRTKMAPAGTNQSAVPYLHHHPYQRHNKDNDLLCFTGKGDTACANEIFPLRP